MKKNNAVLITIIIVILLALVIGATYAYFATGNLNITNVANVNTVTERNNMVFDTLGGGMSLNITAANMSESLSGNLAAENNTTLTVNFTANTSYSMVCTYDIVYEWTSSDKYTAHTSGVSSNEFTIQGTLANNAHVSEGTNNISSETDLSTLTYTNYSATVVSGAQIDGTGNTTSTAVWTLTSKFYNVNADQSTLSGKTYAGKFKVANVSCVAGTVSGGENSNPSIPVPVLSDYWFGTCPGVGLCEFPDYGGELQETGLDTGHNVYIGQDENKYYACAMVQGHEICLSQPYTQYGLENHVFNELFSVSEQTSAIHSLIQVFGSAGVTINESNCSSPNKPTSYITCTVGEIVLQIFDQAIFWQDEANNFEESYVYYQNNKAICNGN